jgi:hypothetical protein
MDKTSGKPNNDRNIFDSVTSLMKAQAYELTALPQRNRPPSIYQFNLVSVIDTDLVRLDFGVNGDIVGIDVDEETYIARYIIAKQQMFARIHIIQFAALFRSLKRYNALHEANVAFFGSLNKQFYDEVVRSGDFEVFREDFIGALSSSIRWRYKFGEQLGDIGARAVMSWSEQDKEVRIEFDLSPATIDSLNNHNELRLRLAELLKKWYRYEGKSRFAVYDIPF